MSQLHARISLQRDSAFRLQVDVRFPTRGLTAIYGPSGSGKTTLLYCIAGLLRGDSESEISFGDQVWQQGEQLTPTHQRKVGFVFQDARLFPHLSVRGNLAFALDRKHGSSGPTLEQVCSWLRLDELLELASDQLSRGQQQRVAIARALLSAPDILLLDEPLANIDLKSRREIIQHLQELQRDSAIPMLYVSHDMEEVANLADWLVVMECGSIAAQGSLLELCSRLELALAHEEQAAVILQAQVAGHDKEYGLTELLLEGQSLFLTTLATAPGQTLRLRVPARDVSLCLEAPTNTSILNILRAKITEIEMSDDSRLLLRLQVGTQYLLARLTRKSVQRLNLRAGQEVYAQIKSVALLNNAGT
jgi:molybdate transport system ATP-binding protein